MADQRRGGIAWTDFSINPIRARDRTTGKVGHWCEKVSQGCTHCFSSTLQWRFHGHPFEVSHRDQVEVYLEPKALNEVLRRQKPARWFWCDMSDLFGAWVPNEWIYRCLAVMALTPQHTHQILTKRAERLRAFFLDGWEAVYYGLEDTPEYRRVEHEGNSGNKEWSQEAADRVSHARRAMDGEPLSNIWCGVSVEDRQHLDRLALLHQTPAAVRFVSFEPFLEDLGDVDLTGIDQAIYGGESGPNARPCDLAWIRRGIACCRKSRTAPFVKQLGAFPIYSEDTGEPFGPGIDGDDPIAVMPGGKIYHRLKLKDRQGANWDEWWFKDLRVREWPA